MGLDGQAAIVTGASSGIGTAVARMLVGLGGNVVVTARRSDRLQTLVDELGSCRAVAVPADIADPKAPQRLLDACLEAFDRCDILFNGAGTMHVGGIDDLDLDAACQMIRVNVEAPTRLAYTVLRHFQASGAGHLINVSSILGTKVRPTTGVYAGTKFAIEALTEALRMEVAGTDIRVTAIEPGLVDTELQDHFPQHPKDLLGMTELLRPEDIARAVRFVLEQPSHVRIPRMMVLPGQQAM